VKNSAYFFILSTINALVIKKSVIELYSIHISLRANLTAQGSVTKWALVRRMKKKSEARANKIQNEAVYTGSGKDT
jgi:hypothetical protein